MESAPGFIPNRPPPRTFTVMAKRLVTPGMLRVTLGGPALAGFPEGQEGGYLKLRMPAAGRQERPIVRTYTIAHQRADGLDVDFALHGTIDDAGPATRWALSAQPGDLIEAGGPGAAKPLPAGFAFYLVAGDMTALPAIAANLRRLPAEARGQVFLEIASDEDRQDLPCPAGLAITWLVNAHPGAAPMLLAEAVRSKALPLPDGTYAWAACEFSAMRALRQVLREEQGLGPDRLYISSYWKAGLSEDDHRKVKRADAEEER